MSSEQAITDEMRAAALFSALARAKNACDLPRGGELGIDGTVELILKVALARRLEPQLYELCWWLKKPERKASA